MDNDIYLIFKSLYLWSNAFGLDFSNNLCGDCVAEFWDGMEQTACMDVENGRCRGTLQKHLWALKSKSS